MRSITWIIFIFLFLLGKLEKCQSSTFKGDTFSLAPTSAATRAFVAVHSGVKNYIMCAGHCLNTKDCMGLHYAKESKKCHLLSDVEMVNSELMSVQGNIWLSSSYAAKGYECPKPIEIDGNVRNTYIAKNGVAQVISTCLYGAQSADTYEERVCQSNKAWSDLRKLQCKEKQRPESFGCKVTQAGLEYIGNTSVTVSGKKCVSWTSYGYTSEQFPDMDVRNASNFCRNPSHDPQGPWCYTEIGVLEFCLIPVCDWHKTTTCRSSKAGWEYFGYQNSTSKGECLPWEGRLNGTSFIQENLEDVKNYCRNPDNRTEGPWCFTKYGSEYCQVPLCDSYKKTDCKTTQIGWEYMGNLSQGLGGYTCDPWDSNNLGFEYKSFPDASLSEAANYCRNPEGYMDGPFCYYMNMQQICNVPICEEKREVSCVHTLDAWAYLGNVSITIEGEKCLPWTSSPNTDYADAQMPDKSLAAASNYCRALGQKHPWCYTNDDGAVGICSIPVCENSLEKTCKTSARGWEYAGTLALTISGKECVRWADIQPDPGFKDVDFHERNRTLASNFCRNPGEKSDHGPWCFTDATGSGSESCDVRYCDSVYQQP